MDVFSGGKARPYADDQWRVRHADADVAFGNGGFYDDIRLHVADEKSFRIDQDRQNLFLPESGNICGGYGELRPDALYRDSSVVHRLRKAHRSADSHGPGNFQHDDAAQARIVQTERRSACNVSRSPEDNIKICNIRHGISPAEVSEHPFGEVRQGTLAEPLSRNDLTLRS